MSALDEGWGLRLSIDACLTRLKLRRGRSHTIIAGTVAKEFGQNADDFYPEKCWLNCPVYAPALFRRLFMAILAQLAAAIAFYTCLPIPANWSLKFHLVARWAPLIGLVLGCLLVGLDLGLMGVGMAPLTRSAVVVAIWLALTGGLHLDGAMDTADGLAVTDPSRRLAVMADSATGAFGAMTAVVLLLLKTVALAEIDTVWVLPLALGWGRWGQQVAIARYPYLKPSGKGAFHKAALPSLGHTLPSLWLLLGLSTVPAIFGHGLLALGLGVGGSAIALWVPAWLNAQLGGHTGDTYGAVVEWTEAMLLVVWSVLF